MRGGLVIRETLDWRAVSYDGLRDEAIREAARFWDECFAISYTECRAQVKEQAAHWNAQLEGINVIPQPEVKRHASEVDWLLVADDDDWYHPQLLHHLAAIEAPLCLWSDGVFGYHIGWSGDERAQILPCITTIRQRHVEDSAADFSALKTNNYAISSDFLRQNDTAVSALMGHASGADYIAREAPEMARLGVPLSLVNRHPCSYLVLTHFMQQDGTQDGLVKLLSDYCEANVQLRGEFAWVQPAIGQVQAIFAQTLASSLK